MANDSYQLVVRNAPQSGLASGQIIALEDDVLTLGRDPLSDMIIDDPEVSRHHAKLSLQETGYTVQDMGSTNGTFVDGKRLGGEPLALKPGQVIMLGSNVTLVYQAIAAVDPMATMVAPAAPVPEPEEIAADELAVVDEVVEESDEDFEAAEAALPVFEPVEVEPEVSEEPEVLAEEIIEEDEEDFATMMDESPLVPPLVEEVAAEEPFVEVAPEPEPLPEAPIEPMIVEEEVEFDLEPPAPLEPQVATFDELEERTYIDSAAPVADFSEMPAEPASIEVPPAPPLPPVAEMDEPQGKSSSNRNMIIIAVVAVLLICCCLALAVGAAAYFNVFAGL